MSTDGEEHAGITFIKTLFGPSTVESVYCCSLANDKGDSNQVSERSICDRDTAALTTFLNRWDRDGRGCYFSLSTFRPGARRQKPNAVETPAFAADIDFKSILEDEHKVDQVLSTCRCVPSLVVSSGHGRHPYWILKEALPTQDYLERVEAVQRQLADAFAGDLQVAHVVALMRLPGTHNTKGGQWWEVEVTPDNGRRYELDELEEWLAEQSPLLTRKLRPKPPEQNPYLAIAERLEFKPSTDVEQRLAAMVYQGAGEAAIHATQLAVSASLISRGHQTEEVVSTLLHATRAAAGDYGARWNWRREESNIRRMCETWATKIKDVARAQIRASGGDADARLINISEARAARAKPASAPAVDKQAGKKFHIIAEATIAALRARGEDLLFEDGFAFHYADGLWARKADHRQWLQVQIERTCRQAGLPSTTRLINEVRNWIERSPDLWSEGTTWDQHGLVPTRSGLVDPISFELHQARPEHLVTWRVTCVYDPDAACPHWLQMLEDAFADRDSEARAAVIATLQECLGAALLDSKPRGLRKALVLLGGTASGKSALLQVMGGLFGETIGTPLAAVDSPHGLMPFLRRLPWVLDEAFNQNVWHLSGTVKTLITGEGIEVNIKNGPMLSRHYQGPIFWATNHPPQFKESTKAIVGRLVVIACRQHFDEGRPVGAGLAATRERLPGPAALVVARELPGVLRWALEGLKRALERGKVAMPDEVLDAAAQIYRDSNLVAGFVEECVDYDPDGRVSVPDFCVAVSAWFAENKGENRSLPSNESIGRALVALHNPRIVTDRYELRDRAMRYVIGIRLNAQGMDYHQRGVSADLFEGKTVQTTSAGGLVNQAIPASWSIKVPVKLMRLAHAQYSESTESGKKELSSGDDNSNVTDGADAGVGHRDESPSQSLRNKRDPLF